ncbi:CAP domain-containing protein [Streptomyces poriticola]|uniref:CAP domain-containing protein n=1 Tax=Streptomyces poriticola TaxID=3120506 RepID=UPI002FCE2E84
MLLPAESCRRGHRWKLRAPGQGHADGLAGLARDLGVEVLDDGAPADVGVAVAAEIPGTADGFLRAVNSARAAAGSPPVKLDARLAPAARAHAAVTAGTHRAYRPGAGSPSAPAPAPNGGARPARTSPAAHAPRPRWWRAG